jgi:hypothetical protein
LLVGIKPYDIVYIPSFGKWDPEKGKYVYYIEDWIVQSVSYDQNDGDIEVSVQGTREYGLGTPMDEKNAEKFLTYAKEQGLVGPNATLENWDRHAWVTPLNSTPTR